MQGKTCKIQLPDQTRHSRLSPPPIAATRLQALHPQARKTSCSGKTPEKNFANFWKVAICRP